jgi:selenocysteine-specific elongation factor
MLRRMKTETAPKRSIVPVTIGTAGHIDHGKTSLLRALAGGRADDVDRLAEEQQRGLTIDVGYAELVLGDGLEAGVVDVPGHEKFVRNMVAGATGIDVVLLVVAADDGVMPQTREHLQIMSLLGLTSGCIAVTKTDTVDAEMLALVRADVEELVRGTFLDGAPIHAVSSVTGEGIDALRDELARLVRSAPRRDAEGLFRMPVLRVFTSPGFGTIVTGIPVSGHLAVGDAVEIQPGRRAGRVRGLQVYHRPSDRASAGHRTAINVADVDHRRVQRGDVVCAPDAFDAASILDVKLRVLPGLPHPLRHGQEVRLHVGTLDAGAKVLLVGGKQVAPGEWGWAQLRLDKPAVTAPGDRFILRVPALLETLGGGVVLGVGEERRRRGANRAAEFEERERGLADPARAVESHVRRAGLAGTTSARIARDVKCRADEAASHLAALVGEGRVVELARGVLVHADTVAAGEAALLEAVRRGHARAPLAAGVGKAPLADEIGASPEVADGLVERLRADGRVVPLDAGRVRLADYAPVLTETQARHKDEILAMLARDPWQAPRASELPRLLGALDREVEDLLALLEDQGRIARLRDGIVLTSEAIDHAKARIAEHIRAKGSLAPADLKDLIGATRKFGIPLLEHLDAAGFTRRQGDVRLLR